MTGARHQESEWALRDLCDALRLLAADPDGQIAALSAGTRGHIDDLALDFHYAFEAAASVRDTFPQGARDRLKQIAARLEAMSGEANRELWQPEALASADEWREIRGAASAAAEELGCPEQSPS